MALEGMIFDGAINKLEQALKETSQRQAVISHNLANLATPGFSPLSFEEELKSAKNKFNSGEEKEGFLEEQMAKLAENSNRQSAIVRLLASKFAVLRRVVTQGRG